MTVLDLVVLLVTLLAALSGWRAGGLRTVVGLVLRLAGLGAGLLVAHVVALTGWPFLWRVVAEAGAVLLGLLVGGRMTRLVAPRRADPSTPDRVLGAVVRGGVVAVVLTGILALVAAPWGPAGAARTAASAAGDLRGALPGDLDGVVPALGPTPTVTGARLSAAEAAATVQVTTAGSTGSGFVVSGGRVVTARHVVVGRTDVAVVTDGATLPARVVVDDARTDVAVLRVDGLDVTPVAVAAGRVAPGTATVVAGYPGGGPLTAGTATVVGGTVLPAAGDGGLALRPAYRLAADVRPGNSGGPLFDATGAVVGLIDARSLTDPDVGFAITTEPVLAALARA